MASSDRRAHLLLAVLTGSGCAQISTDIHPLGAQRIEQLRAQVEGRRADVLLDVPAKSDDAASVPTRLNGRVYIEEAMVRVVQDQQRVHRQPLLQVREIDASHAGMGAALGGLGGVLTAVVAGSVFGAAIGRDCSGPEILFPAECYSRGQAAGDSIALFMLPAVALGAAIGAIVGSGPVWRFSSPPAAR